MKLKTFGVVCATLALLVAGCATTPTKIAGPKGTILKQEVLVTKKPPSWKDRGLAFIIPVATGSAGAALAQAWLGEEQTYFTKFEDLKTDNGIADAARNGAVGSIPFALWHAYSQKGEPAWVEYTVAFPDGRVGRFQLQEFDPQPYATGTCVQLLTHPESVRVILGVTSATGCKTVTDVLEVTPSATSSQGKPDVNSDDLAASIFFSFDSSGVKPEDKELLTPAAEFIMDHKGYGARIVGHTDSCGSTAYNYKLGMKRAKAAASVLVQLGVLPELIQVESAGESEAAVIGITSCANPQQRRTDITIHFFKVSS